MESEPYSKAFNRDSSSKLITEGTLNELLKELD